MKESGINLTRVRPVAAIAAALLLQGCLVSDPAEEQTAPSGDSDIRVIGSVGDGPIAGAAMRILANDGAVLAEFQGTMTAEYDVTVNTDGGDYPLTVEASGGIDLVTDLPPDFVLRGAVLQSSDQAVANVNPYSTLAVQIANELTGGVTVANVSLAESLVVDNLNFGLTSLASSGPMSTPIGPDNIAEIVRASEAVGELVRRTLSWLAVAGVAATGDSVLESLASDLVDGVLDGRGGIAADPRTAAIASTVAAQIALEVMANELRVNGVDGANAMSNAIRQVAGDSAQSLNDLTVTQAILFQARIGVAAVADATDDPALASLLDTSMGLQPGMEAAFVRNLLPTDYRQRVDSALTLVASGDDALIEEVNSIVRAGDTNPDVNRVPTIGGTPSPNAQVGVPYSFAPSASDPDGDPLTFSGANIPGWASLDPSDGTVSGTPSDNDVGTYNGISISVSDGLEIATLGPFSISVSTTPAPNSPPTIDGSPATNVQAGSSYEFTPEAVDPDGDPLTFSVQNRPSWATFDNATGSLNGTPDDSDTGTYTGIRITVSDGEASDTLGPFSITVSSTPPQNSPPTIAGNPATTVQANTAYGFTPNASDADGDPLTFSVQNLPSWASFDTADGTISGTPDDGDVNIYGNITITVSDGEDSASLGPFSISVEALSTGSVTLSWTAPTENTDGTPLTDLAGYRFYWGQNGNYPNSVTFDNPGLTSVVIENVPAGIWEFVSTAINAQGVESNHSNAVEKTVP